MCDWSDGGVVCIMKNEENIKISVIDKESYDRLKDIEEVIEILFEIIKEEHKKVTLLYVIVSLLIFVSGLLVLGG